MLFYTSLHPEWDGFGTFGQSPAGREISELLGAVVSTHYRNTGRCFAELERMGLFLGNGAFQTILVQRDPFGQVDPIDQGWVKQVVATGKDILHVPIWLCLSHGGRIYLLCAFPRVTEGSADAIRTAQTLGEAVEMLQQRLSGTEIPLRLILSDIQFEEMGIFRTFNDLNHAMDYYDFRTTQVSPIRLNSEQLLHGAMIQDLSAYRQVAVEAAEQLSRTPFDPAALADQLVDVILEKSAPSMESVHYHIQVFMLTLTEYLGDSGTVDAAYMARHKIVYRCMAFERENQMRENLGVLLEELHRQNQTLRKIGRQNRIRSIREYVETHIGDQSLTAAQISDRFQIGTAQIAKQFRYYYGVSLHRFIQQARFQRAQQLLRENPDWSMHRVAEEAGYTDLSTMYRAFRTLGNITPGALRDALHSCSLGEEA